jgi:hypothetical protein
MDEGKWFFFWSYQMGQSYSKDSLEVSVRYIITEWFFVDIERYV